jgi:hypothetical protein
MGGGADEHYRAMAIKAVATVTMVMVATNAAHAADFIGSILGFLCR